MGGGGGVGEWGVGSFTSPKRLPLHAVIYNGSIVNFTCNTHQNPAVFATRWLLYTGVDCNVLAMSVLFGTKEAGCFRDVAAL